MPQQSFVPVLIALQLAAFGWRINREITVGDQDRKTWMPVCDHINIISLLAVIITCVVVPLGTGGFNRYATTVLAVAYIFIGFHPVNMAAHYRLFSRQGRNVYTGDYPYITGQEIFTVIVSITIATVAGIYVYHSY